MFVVINLLYMNKCLLLTVLLALNLSVFAQNWMPGYEFRKKITFDKSKIEGDFINTIPRVELDVPDFTVLLELQDEAFKYRHATACSGFVADLEGRNVAFATVASPMDKLSFQIESYDPVLGRYRCWVRIPSLASVRTATPATQIYFYYGGSALHDNYSTAGLNTWNGEYTGVWHMNGEKSDLGSGNEKTGLAVESLTGHGFVSADRIAGKVGDALELNGESKYLHTSGHGNGAFTLMAWIKWNGGTGSQTIATTDSVVPGRSGWRIGINAEGKIEMSTYRTSSVFWSLTSSYAVTPGVWTQLVCYYSINGASNSGLTTFLNGSPAGGSGGSGLRLGPGGYMAIGRNKDGSQHFNGAIDELHLYNVVKSTYWIKNEYRNQSDPLSFYSVGAEEFDPSWATFTGAVNTTWATTANWLNNLKPVTGGKVRISAGKTTRITGADVVFGQLVLEPGTTLSSAVNLQLDCDVKLAAGTLLTMDEGKKLLIAGSGLKLSGAGTVYTAELEVNALNASSEVLLEAEVKVSKAVKLSRGKLNANGKLTLLAAREGTAALLPVLDRAEAGIRGKVNVQHFVQGAFPNPSTGRGWRLLSSPVVHTSDNSVFKCGFADVKNAVFVTGKAGVVNGFDASPNNGATIYTHDQALAGTLSQKYVAIPNMDAAVPLGRGFYLFSRGSKMVANAYRDQLQAQPFANPAPYVLTYTGDLFVGDLRVEVFNRNGGGEGDGFNLVGNPYASPVLWGSLDKVNLMDAVWLWDPLNNGYYATNDANAVIASGAGFFVRVKGGEISGSVGFSESSKYNYGSISSAVPSSSLPLFLDQQVIPPFLEKAGPKILFGNARAEIAHAFRTGPARLGADSDVVKEKGGLIDSFLPRERSSMMQRDRGKQSPKATLRVVLERNGFSQPFLLVLSEGGRAGLSDGDAVKVGEGFVSIGSVSDGGVKLAIDERGATDSLMGVRLLVKGYETGTYSLRFFGLEGFLAERVLSLRDNYLNAVRVLGAADTLVHFDMDVRVPESFGEGRFVLGAGAIPELKKEMVVVVYPNPFMERLYVRVDVALQNAVVVVTDLLGRVVRKKGFGSLLAGSIAELELANLQNGMYILQVFDGGRRIGKGFKVMKR
jgi:hypothetical protein